jgi:hypothetical protein
MTPEPFKSGDRVRLSELGLRHSIGSRHGYTGQVIELLSAKTVRVLFDGQRDPTQLPTQWLERDRDW